VPSPDCVCEATEPSISGLGVASDSYAWGHDRTTDPAVRIALPERHGSFIRRRLSLREILGKGLRVPATEAARVERIIAAVTGVVAIHSDIGESLAGELVPPDMRPVIQLTPDGDGMTVRVRVSPLGADGPALTPGQGPSTVTVLRSGHTVAAQRDLPAELARIDAVLQACPALFAGEVGASGDWQLESSAASFELLLQLEAGGGGG